MKKEYPKAPVKPINLGSTLSFSNIVLPDLYILSQESTNNLEKSHNLANISSITSSNIPLLNLSLLEREDNKVSKLDLSKLNVEDKKAYILTPHNKPPNTGKVKISASKNSPDIIDQSQKANQKDPHVQFKNELPHLNWRMKQTSTTTFTNDRRNIAIPNDQVKANLNKLSHSAGSTVDLKGGSQLSSWSLKTTKPDPEKPQSKNDKISRS